MASYTSPMSVSDDEPPPPPGFTVVGQAPQQPAANDEPPPPPGFTVADTPAPSSSATGAFARSAVKGVLPSGGGYAGFLAGAEGGAALGAALPGANVTGIPELVLGLGGGAAGAIAGSEIVRGLQTKLMSYFPNEWLKALGMDPEQGQADVSQHPYASMTGDVVSNLPYLGPGLLTAASRAEAAATRAALPATATPIQRIAAAPATAPIAGAVLGGGQQAATDLYDTGTVDPTKVAIAATAGLLQTRETKLGAAVADLVPGGLKLFQTWRGNVGVVDPKAPATAQEVHDFGTFLKTQGVTDPANVTPQHVTNILNVLSGTPTPEPTPRPEPKFAMQDAGGATAQQFQAEQERLAQEKQAVSEGDIAPGAASTAGRTPVVPVPPVIPVTPAGQGDVSDPAINAALDKFGARGGLPVVTAPQPTRLTPDEVAHAQAAAAVTGQPVAPQELPGVFTTPADRAPQTPTDVAGQRQAGEAFTAANIQRGRVTPNAVDVQPGGRPQGAAEQPVVLDEGFPVQILDRHHVEVNGKPIEMATVHRYDPRTGALDPEAIPYDVPVKNLKKSNYAVEPRAAQDVTERSKGPEPIIEKGDAEKWGEGAKRGAPEQPRGPDQAVRREPAQTYRADTSAADPAREPLPGAQQPIPDQPEGPHPGPQRPTSEEEAIRDYEARQRGGQQQQRRQEEPRKTDNKTSTTAKAPGADGRYEVDDRGFVASDKGGPLKFAEQKQAAKWIINEGHKKSPDQIFEIENHPSGKGFGVRERGRAEAKTAEEPSRVAEGASAAGARDQPPGTLAPPREAPVVKPADKSETVAREAAQPNPKTEPVGQPNPELEKAREDIARLRREPAGPRPVKGDSLVDAVRGNGGLKSDKSGDLGEATRDYKAPGEFKLIHDGRGAKSINDMIRTLQAQGWFRDIPGGVDDHQFVELLKQDIQRPRGEVDAVRHPDYEPPAVNRAAQEHAALRDDVARSDIQAGDSDEVKAQKLADYRQKRDAEYDAEQIAKEAKAAAHVESLSPDVRDWIHGEDPTDFRTDDTTGNETGGYDPGADYGAEEGFAGEGSEATGGTQGGQGAFSEPIPGFDDEPRTSDNRPGGGERGADKGAGGQSEFRGEQQANRRQSERDNLSGRHDDERQTEIDAPEATREDLKRRQAQRDAEEKQQNPRAHSGKQQKGHDESGLFAQEEKPQADMFAGDGEKPTEPDPNGNTPEEKASAASKLRNSLYSNPAADPEVWREAGRTMADSFGWLRSEAAAWAREWQHSLSTFGDKRPPNELNVQKDWTHTRPMREWIQKLLYSNDGRLRTLAARYKSEALRSIADTFYPAPRGGRDGAVGRDYHSAINVQRTKWMNELGAALEPFKHMDLDKKAEATNQIGKLVQNPSMIRDGTPIGDAARTIQRILKEAHDYLRAANVEVGHVKDYLPRVEDVDRILKDPEGFKNAATRAYMADGMKRADAQKAAQNWFDRVQTGDWGAYHEGGDFSNRGAGGTNVFTQSRTLSKKADAIMGDFFLRNPADVMPAYIGRAVTKAEWSRRYGPRGPNAPVPRGEDPVEWRTDPEGKWKDIKAQMVAEGNGHLIPTAVGIIRSITGNMGSPMGAYGAARTPLNVARTWSALSYLPRSIFSSLAEPMNIAIRTGNTLDGIHAYGETLRQWLPILKEQAGAKYLHTLASDLGFIGEAHDDMTMMQRVGGEGGGLLSKKIQAKFFRAIGLTQLTEANRVAGVKIGMIFMRRLANDIAEGNHYNTISRRLMAELGVPADKVEGFAKYVNSLDKPTAAQLQGAGEHGEFYQTALSRFVSQTVMHPSGAVKPYYAQHPLGSLVWNLQSFNLTFQKNVLNRVGAMTTEALNPKSGLNAHERLYAMMPLLNVVPMVAATWAVGQIKDAIFTDPARKGMAPQTGMQKAERLASRAGLTGSYDMLFNAFTGAKYQHDPLTQLLGPVLGGADTEFGALMDEMSSKNSPTTNTAERKLGVSTYNMVVQPALEAGVLMAVPQLSVMSKIASTAAMYVISHPATREKFVRRFAGPPAPPP